MFGNSHRASQRWPACCGDQRKRTCSADTSTGPSGSFSSNSCTGGTPNTCTTLWPERTPIRTENPSHTPQKETKQKAKNCQRRPVSHMAFRPNHMTLIFEHMSCWPTDHCQFELASRGFTYNDAGTVQVFSTPFAVSQTGGPIKQPKIGLSKRVRTLTLETLFGHPQFWNSPANRLCWLDVPLGASAPAPPASRAAAAAAPAAAPAAPGPHATATRSSDPGSRAPPLPSLGAQI